MIEEIRIRDLGVITDATLTLGPGLSVVTGETGAGKTMVVTALGLLLGARSDAGAVRSGAKSALAESLVRLPEGSDALERAREAGAGVEADDDGTASLVLARTVNADGRSRAHVGGRSAPVGVLGEIGDALVVVHGQSDQLRLKSATAQRHALDRFAGAPLQEVAERYAHAYERHRAAAAQLAELRTEARERIREADALQADLTEIDGIDPQPGEDETLKSEATKLANVEELRAASHGAYQALMADEFAESGDANTLIDEARRQLAAVAGHDDELSVLAERTAELGVMVADVARDLAGYEAALDTDGPGRLAEIEDRRATLSALIRKFAPTVDEVLAWADWARTRLDELSDDSTRIDALEAEVAELGETLTSLAAEMTAHRTRAAAELGERVSAELSALAMPDAVLDVGVETGAELGPHGADTVALLLRPHQGAPARPLGKGASGGELSRVMLAIEVVLAAVDPVPTFVFDEVDAGVGGRAAVEIGRRLAMLARHVQVIVVTHLPQVAAFAHQHIRVLKTSVPGADAAAGADTHADGVTASDVSLLDDDARVRELARMLAGQEDSASAQAHAKELLEDAKAPDTVAAAKR